MPKVLEEELAKRRARGRTERFDVSNLSVETVLSTFSVSGSSGRSYTVEIRSVTERSNRCTCRDFQTNGLGVCKHIEAVLYYLELHHPERLGRLGWPSLAAGGPAEVDGVKAGGGKPRRSEAHGARPFPHAVADDGPVPPNLERFAGLKIVVFDLETQRGTEAVRAARDLRGLPISVGVAYHFVDGTFRQYGEADVDLLVESLFEADCVVGYNIRRFDIPVLRGYTRRQLGRLPVLDLLDGFARKKGRSLSLGRVAQATLGTGKSGDGMQAIRLFERGEWGRLVSYCRDDVRITRDLLLAGIARGRVWTKERTGEKVPLPVGWADEVSRMCGLPPAGDESHVSQRSGDVAEDGGLVPRRKAE